MGLSLKLPKVKIDTKKLVPKIKADPTKLAKNYFEGIGNVVSSGVSQVGKVAATPGASTVLGGAGMAAGIPGLGNLIPSSTAFVDRKSDFDSQPRITMPQTQDFKQPNNTVYYIAAGVVLVVGLAFAFIKRK